MGDKLLNMLLQFRLWFWLYFERFNSGQQPQHRSLTMCGDNLRNEVAKSDEIIDNRLVFVILVE